MKSTLATFFSYFFMATILLLCISIFAVIVILGRHFFGSIGEQEKNLGYTFLIILIASAILAPISLYINLKFDRMEKLKDEEIY